MKTRKDSKRRCPNGSPDRNPSSLESAEADDIPEWMLLEVLMRLPFKFLFKCKTVSKRWCSMISYPSFARMYVDRISWSPRNLQDWILVSSYSNKVMTRQFVLKKLQEKGRCPLGMINSLDLLLLPRDHSIGVDEYVVATSNGFFLYGPRAEFGRRYHACVYEICNPITGQRIHLPPSARCFAFVATGFIAQVQDNILRSYRVVRVDVHHANSGFVRFDVYSSETRRWEYFNIHTLVYFYKWKHPVVVRQTTLHWMITKHRVMAYDPYNSPKSVRLIRLPSDDAADYALSKLELDDVLFDQHQGRLRYVELKLDPEMTATNLSIWVLEDYDSGTWGLQHRVRVDGVDISSVPLYFHPFDSNILYILNEKALYSYDVKAGELNVLDDSNRNVYYFYHLRDRLSDFSFVIPPWPVFINPSLL